MGFKLTPENIAKIEGAIDAHQNEDIAAAAYRLGFKHEKTFTLLIAALRHLGVRIPRKPMGVAGRVNLARYHAEFRAWKAARDQQAAE